MDGLLCQPVEEFAARRERAAVETDGKLIEIILEIDGADRTLVGAHQPTLEQGDAHRSSCIRPLRMRLYQRPLLIAQILPPSCPYPQNCKTLTKHVLRQLKRRVSPQRGAGGEPEFKNISPFGGPLYPLSRDHLLLLNYGHADVAQPMTVDEGFGIPWDARPEAQLPSQSKRSLPNSWPII